MRRRLKPARKVRKQRSFLGKRYFWIVSVCVMACAGLAYGALFSPWVQLRGVEIAGVAPPLKEEVALEASRFLKGSILFVNTKAVERALRAKFPQIEKARADRALFGRTVRVTVQERTQVALACREHSCVALDRHGILFAPVQDTGEFLRIEGDSDFELVLGREFLDEALFSALFFMKDAAKELDVEFVSFEIVTKDRVSAASSEGWEVIFNPRADTQWQMTKLEAVMNQKLPQDKRKGVEYVDLRFGDQAYIKYAD